ncbi:hypothetical protein [Xanthobacter wiegelii]|uniref:hypothetical protein n=1 Tax=Xanthobacter wiegelii TaxID=3119913 RepID=UPI0037290700
MVLIILTALWLNATAGITLDRSRADLSIVGEALRRGESFPVPDITAMINKTQHLMASPLCIPRDTGYITLLHNAQVQAAFANNEEEAADGHLAQAEAAARRTLACNPSSQLAWFTLAWADFLRKDYSASVQSLLRMSEQVAPLEGWSVIHRVKLMLMMLPQTDATDRARLRSQIQTILAAQGYHFLAATYIDSDEEQQKFLRTVFAEAEERDQKWLTSLIRTLGGDIDLPHARPLGSRPWER